VWIIVTLFVKRAGRLYVSSTCDAHQFFAGGLWVPGVFQHMRGIDIVKSLVLERERFHRSQKKGEPYSLYRLPTFRIILGKKIDQVSRVLMRSVARSNIQDPSLRGFPKSSAKVELTTNHHPA
jgi:hypothetical protein